MKKLLILEPYADNGCSWYRLKQFGLVSKKHGLDTQFLNMSLPEERLAQVIDSADAYLLRLSDLVAIEIFDQFEWDKINKPIFLDIDDNYENVDPLSDLYRAYGTQEVTLQDGTFLWRDGVNLDIDKNEQRLEKFRNIMRKCTAVIVTTFELKNYANQYNPNAVIIPNAINLDIFPKVKDTTKQSDEIRLLWSGGSTHYPDLLEVKDSLKRLMERNYNLHFYILGVPFKGIIKDLPQERVHAMGWVQPNGHGYRLACIDADISICPLKQMVFNENKSSIKYYETAALYVPTVAKDMPPYKDDITDGINGLLYSTTDEFEAKVQLLIDDPLKRLEIGTNARRYVEQNRERDSIAADWCEFILGTIDIFSASLDADPSKIKIITHTDFAIEPLEGKNGMGVMDQGLKQLRKQNIHHWISSGTLLGLYRDGKLIPHDTDIDVNVLDAPEITLKDFTPIRSMYYDGKPMQSAFMKDGVIFDIYYFYSGIKPGFAINYNEHGIIEKPLEYITKLDSFRHGSQHYPIPAKIEQFLVWRFGADWKTPRSSKQSWEKDATHLKPY